MNFKPTLDKVLVKQCKIDDVVDSTIYLGKDVENELCKLIYKVVEIGDGYIDDDGVEHPIVVNVGDKVIVNEYVGSELNLDNELCRVVRQCDIIAILED